MFAVDDTGQIFQKDCVFFFDFLTILIFLTQRIAFTKSMCVTHSGMCREIIISLALMTNQ